MPVRLALLFIGDKVQLKTALRPDLVQLAQRRSLRRSSSNPPGTADHGGQPIALPLQDLTAFLRVAPGHQEVQVVLITIGRIEAGARSQSKALQIRVRQLRPLKTHVDRYELVEHRSEERRVGK